YDQIESIVEILRRQVTRIHVFTDLDSGFLTKLPIQLAMPDVKRNNARGSALQQAIGEPAGRGANVKTDFSFDINPKLLKSRRQFYSAAAYKRQGFFHQ